MSDNQPATSQPSTATAGRPAAEARTRGGWWSNLSLRSKLLAMLLATSLLSSGAFAWISYSSGRTVLTEQTMQQLTSLRSGKRHELEWYFHTMRNSLRAFSEDVAVSAAIAMFKDGYNQLGKPPLSEDRRKALENYYKQDFLAKLAKTMPAEPLIENFLPRQDRALELQSLFITENSYPLGERDKLLDHPAHNAYTLAHNTYHKWFRELADRFNFYDMFLIDGETGQILYTVDKEVDFGTNLLDGPYATSNLGRLFRKVVQEREHGYVKMTDFEFYGPSLNAPAMFIATPIYSNWKFMGVLAAQVSPDALDTFMTSNRTWRDQGLGASGEMLVIGDDLRLRSNSRFMIEDKATFLAGLGKLDLPKGTVELTAQNGSTILTLHDDSKVILDALAGKSGTELVNDYRGKAVIASNSPLAIDDVRWVLETKIDQAEALAPQADLNRKILIAACLLSLATTLAALWMAWRFLRPLQALLGGVEKLRTGDSDARVEGLAHDEFGRLGQAFNAMASTIRDRNEVIVAKTKGYESLLRHIFPEVIAERLKKGEGQVADSFAQVSVIFVSIDGFITEAEPGAGRSQSPLELLNQIVDAFDAAAEELGVEKIKTIGEHYMAGCGLTIARLDHARRAVDFADRCAAELARINQSNGISLGLRVGIASGPVHAGLVGSRRFVYDIWGQAPNAARAIVHDTGTNEVRLDEETYQLLREPADFGDLQIMHSRTQGDLRTHGRRLAVTGAVPAAVPAKLPANGSSNKKPEAKTVRT